MQTYSIVLFVGYQFVKLCFGKFARSVYVLGTRNLGGIFFFVLHSLLNKVSHKFVNYINT